MGERALPEEPERRPLRVGVSACLLGERVRWDGGHKRDRFLVDLLGKFVEFVPVCPEQGMGLSTPRETLRLAGDVDDPRLVFGKTGADQTERMRAFAKCEVERLAQLDLCGYVLKSDSPSCGMERVRVWSEHGMPLKRGVGLFARALMEHLPLLPVEEEGRLNDAQLRETFIERLFAYRRWRDLCECGVTPGRLVDFHRVHKYLLLAHSPEHYASLGRLVARGKSLSRADLRDAYGTGYMDAMSRKATRGRHYNVLQHMAGYFKRGLDSAGVSEVHRTLDDYSVGLVPLIVPLTLIAHHVRVLAIGYLADQIYLAPHPKELMLRNHV